MKTCLNENQIKRFVTLAFVTILSCLELACSRAAFDAVVPEKAAEPQIDSSAVSLEDSTIYVAPDQIADGATPAEVQLTLRNRRREPLAGILMAIQVSGSGNVMNSCTTSDQNGRSRCRVFSTVAELKEIRAVGSVVLTAQAIFIAPAPTSSAFGIVSSSGSDTLPNTTRLVAMTGVSESNAALRDSYGYVRVFSSILGSVVGE